MKIELVKRYEIQIILVCMALLALAAGWLLLTRPAYRIEGDFLRREDQRNAADGWLAERLQSTIAEHRARACLALGRIGDETTLELLLKALRDPAASVRAAAAFAIGEMEDRETLAELGRQPQKRAAEALLGALDDEERTVIARAVEALGKLKWKPAVLQLIQTPAPLPITFVALARLREPDLAPWIAQGLKSNDQDTRWAAAVALIEMDAPIEAEITRSFLNLTKDINRSVRALVVRGLGRAKTSAEVLKALTQMTTDRDAKVRIEALGSLGRLGSREALPVLVKAVGDPNENVRATAVKAMAALGNRDALPLLQSLRFYPSPVSYQAEWALSVLAQKDEEFFAGLQGIPTAYRSPAGMESFAAALGNYRSSRGVEWLMKLWQSQERYARRARSHVLPALAVQQIPELAEYLAEGLEDPDAAVQRTGLELLTSPTLEACRKAWHRAREASALPVQLAALDAAARVEKGPNQKQLFLEALHDAHRLVRTRAVKYLRLLFDEDHAEKIGMAETRHAPEHYQRIARTISRRLQMETTVGVLDVAVDYDHAPLTAENFVELARQGYYNGQRFASVVPNQLIKVGGDHQQGPGYTIRSEVNYQPFLRGSLGMVTNTKDSGSARFFVCLSRQPLLDGRYTNFGRLISGDKVLDRITTETRILRVVVP